MLGFWQRKGQLHLERKEERRQWSEKTYRVNLKSRDMMSNTFYKLEGLTKGYKLLLDQGSMQNA